MKKYNSCILGLLAMVAAFSSCAREEVPFYDKSSNGIYFNYDNTSQLKDTVNFADYVLDSPDEITSNLNLRLVGYVTDTDRKFAIKTREVDGLPMPQIELGEGVLPAGTADLSISYTLHKPEQRDQMYAVEIYLDSEDASSDLGEGIEGYDKYTLYVTEQYKEPSGWSYPAGTYLGEWTADKYIFMVHVTGMTDFYSQNKWYNGNFAGDAVDSIRTYNQAHPDTPLLLGIPFSSDITYSQPYYWGEEQTKYLGEYNSGVFAAIASAVGATTDNEAELLSGDEARMKELNKAGVRSMMEKFNSYYYWQMPVSQFKYSNPTIPMFADVDYEVVQPACWSEGSDTYASISHYYGAYSEAKYKFMLKTWLANRTQTDDFPFVQIFPIYYGYDYTTGSSGVNWDSGLGGEDAIKECYRVFKAEYDKSPDSYDFTFPTVGE